MTNPAGTKMWYPLRTNGSGCTLNNQRVGGLIKIELLNLPVTTVGISPASQSVANSASFTVDLAIDTDTACPRLAGQRGIRCRQDAVHRA